MSDTDTNEHDAMAATGADEDKVNDVERNDEGEKENEVDEDGEADSQAEAQPDDGQEKKNKLVPEEPESEVKSVESEHEGDEQVVPTEKSPTPDKTSPGEEAKSAVPGAGSPTDRLGKPPERTREPSEELEYEPLLDEQMGEGDREQEAEVSSSGVVSEAVGETTVQSDQSKVPSDRQMESDKSQVGSDSQQVFEAPVAPVRAPRPPSPKTGPPTVMSAKRQVSWEPRIETYSIDQSKTTSETDQHQSVEYLGANDGWEQPTRQVAEPGRVVYTTVPGMNSHSSQPSHIIQSNQVTNQMASMSMDANLPASRRPKQYQSALYRRKPITQQSTQPFYVQPNYCNAPQVAPTVPSHSAPHESVESQNNYPVQSAIQTTPPPPPPPLSIQSRSVATPVQSAPSHPSYTQPTRKISGTPPYVGSQVIATETGPSITVLLRRPTSERHWGFTFFGGSENGCPPFVNKVTSGSLAAQHGMEVGDVIVSICNSLTVGKTQEQLKADILRAGNELDLVLIRRGVDLNKIAQLAPKAVPSAVRSPPPGSVGLQDKQFSFSSSTQARSPRIEPSVSRGHSFRSIKTKSIRILEEQLASGQTPASSIQTKQHFQGARGLPATGTASSYMQAYGQNRNQGYLGRTGTESGLVDNATAWSGSDRETVVPVQSVKYAQPVYAPYEPSHFSDYGAARWDQGNAGQPNWETQSYAGQPSGWAMPTPTYPKQALSPVNISSPQPIVYPNPSYPPGTVFAQSVNMTVPMHTRPEWPNRS